MFFYFLKIQFEKPLYVFNEINFIQFFQLFIIFNNLKYSSVSISNVFSVLRMFLNKLAKKEKKRR